jgi:thioredoxin-like negative regulator of GroEL
LTHEVELLSRATRALHAGRAAEALKALDEYRRKYPKGSLRDEEAAARAQVLCDLGRFDEARARIAELPSQSPLSVRARQFCDLRMK